MTQEYTTELTTEYRTGEREMFNREIVSNCCGARTTEPDKDGLAFCLDCKEHCTAEPLIEEPWTDTLEEANS